MDWRLATFCKRDGLWIGEEDIVCFINRVLSHQQIKDVENNLIEEISNNLKSEGSSIIIWR